MRVRVSPRDWSLSGFAVATSRRRDAIAKTPFIFEA